MEKLATLTLLAVALAVIGCEKKPPPSAEFNIPAADASLDSPLVSSPAVIETGKKLYHGSDCAICHGKEGNGKGVLAKDISLDIHNWKDSAVQKQFSDGDLFYILANGKGRMPGYSKEETPDQMWQIVAFIRSLEVPETTSSATQSGS